MKNFLDSAGGWAVAVGVVALLFIASATLGPVQENPLVSRIFSITAATLLVLLIVLTVRFSQGRLEPFNPIVPDYLSPPRDILEQSVDLPLVRISNRLEKEIWDLRSKAALNLSLGAGLAFGGIGLLGYFVLEIAQGRTKTGAPVDAPLDWKEIVTMLGMRLSLVLLASAFALFFLRLYRSSWDNIKYYQNELTNVESRFAALAVALSNSNPSVAASVVDQLVQTERNFILKQGETTVELELVREEGVRMRDLLQILGVKPKLRRAPSAPRAPSAQT